MFDKTNLSLETIETTLENEGMFVKIGVFWLKSAIMNFDVSCLLWTGFCLVIPDGVGNI